MSIKKSIIKRFLWTFIGGFFVLVNLFAGTSVNTATAIEPVAAETPAISETVELKAPNTGEDDNAEKEVVDICSQELGSVSWRLCPETDKVSHAADWLYEKIEEVLVINPIEAKDGTPIYEIWKYCRSVTNLVFIVFLLIIIYSQLTGMGINNYGIKKALPKLIVAAILVNLSFIICSIAVDASNIIGSNLREIFLGVEHMAASSQGVAERAATYSEYYAALAAGEGLTVVGITAALESGTIWMLIPTVLASLAAVITGLITVAMRQAVVVLLVMVAPLAIVASILPNTDNLAKKWRKLFIKMLVFYPLMSLLFGASSLAGWAIIQGANDGFAVLLGKAVQFFPLFFAWSLMKMSDTFLGAIGGKISGLVRPLISSNRAWADSHRALTRERMLARTNVYTPSARLNQFLTNRRMKREMDTAEYRAKTKMRGELYNANAHYVWVKDKNGKLVKVLSKDGLEAYNMQAESMEMKKAILQDKNNFEEGFSERAKLQGLDEKTVKELERLDGRNVRAADNLFNENMRTTLINLRNSEGRHKRYSDAITAHLDDEHAHDPRYRRHELADRTAARERYESMMESVYGSQYDAQYLAAEAASAFEANKQVHEGKFQKYFKNTVPTQDLRHRLEELSKSDNSSEYISAIIAGMRILNERGDTSLVRKTLYEITAKNAAGEDKLQLGTKASQDLASFLMFEVKDNSPILRRFGKYINLETAHVFDDTKDGVAKFSAKDRRYNRGVTYDEYLNGEYEDYADAEGKTRVTRRPKRNAVTLLNGTSFKGVEREAFKDLEESIADVSTKDGVLDEDKYEDLYKNTFNSILANMVSDQFNYASGSEQIVAFAKMLTGFKPNAKAKKVKIDSVRDDGKATATLLDGTEVLISRAEGDNREMEIGQEAWIEEKGLDADGNMSAILSNQYEEDTPPAGMSEERYDKIRKDTITEFGKAQVPNQIGRSKTDVLYAELAFFDKLARKDPANDTEEKVRAAKVKMFRDTLRPEALKMLARSYSKGNQGDTKVNLASALGWDKDKELLYKDAYPEDEGKNKQKAKADDAVVQTDEEPTPAGFDGFAEFERDLTEFFMDYPDSIDANTTREMLRSAFDTLCEGIEDPRYNLTAAQKNEIRALDINNFSSTSELKLAIEAIAKNR